VLCCAAWKMTKHARLQLQQTAVMNRDVCCPNCALPCVALRSFTSWLVVGVHCQSHRSSIVDPSNVTPRTHLVRMLCVVNAKCHTRSVIVVSFRPPRNADAMDPHNQPRRKLHHVQCNEQQCETVRCEPAVLPQCSHQTPTPTSVLTAENTATKHPSKVVCASIVLEASEGECAAPSQSSNKLKFTLHINLGPMACVPHKCTAQQTIMQVIPQGMHDPTAVQHNSLTSVLPS
jgi:hypothetical protein